MSLDCLWIIDIDGLEIGGLHSDAEDSGNAEAAPVQASFLNVNGIRMSKNMSSLIHK